MCWIEKIFYVGFVRFYASIFLYFNHINIENVMNSNVGEEKDVWTKYAHITST